MRLFDRIKLFEKNDADDTRSKAQKFTDKINQQNKNRKEYFKGRKINRVPGASNEKPTGSVSRGTYKSSPEGQKRYRATKTDIDAKKLLKGAGASGDVSPTAPKNVRDRVKEIRRKRADKLGTPDPFDPDYNKKTKPVDGRTRVGKVFKSKKPVTTSAPEFGVGDTPGQQKVKAMDRKAFKVTKPSDIKLPQSFKDFSTKLRRYKSDVQDLKDVDKATMRTGPSSSKVKVTGGENLTRQDVGMAPSDSPKKKPKSNTSNNAKPLKDVERIKKNKVDTQKADAFKKTDAYKNVAQGKDSSGNYMTPEQRKANFIKQTKTNKKVTKLNKNIKNVISKSDPSSAYDIEQLKKSGMYDDYKKIKDSTRKGGIPKWMKDFDKQYPNKVIKNPKRPDVISIRGSASTNVTPTVRPTQNINKGYFKDLQKAGGDVKKLGTRTKLYKLIKQIKNPLKTAKNIKSLRKRDLAKTALGAGIVTLLAKKGRDAVVGPPAPTPKRYAPVYNKETGALREFDPNKTSMSAKEFNQKYTIKKPK